MAKESGRKYELKTKKQLIAELEVLYKRIATLEKPGDVGEWSEEVLLQHELATCAAIEEMPDGVMLVDAGGKVLLRGGEPDRTGMYCLAFLGLHGESTFLSFHVTVAESTVRGLSAFGEISLNPLNICEARAVGILVDHARRHQVRDVRWG